ncbi:MAG: hypothetical protein PHU85_09380, partial [Phycisphaerae bacterium]|nr:hypothetical protein [Phycisphaerae bacterium]
MKQVIINFASAFDDRSNPILVKEVRQGMRNRGFLIIYGLLLAGLMVLSTCIALLGRDESNVGGTLFYVLAGCMVVVAFLFMPVMAFRSFMAEREQQTMEVLLVSGLDARRIVRGKLFGAALQLSLYVAVIVPFMAMSFLLRGVDIISILTVVGVILLYGVLTLMASIWWASVSGSAGRSNIGLILLILFCGIGTLYGIGAGVGLLMFAGRPALHIEGRVWAGMAVGVAAWTWFYHQMTVNSLMFGTANRATRSRVAFLVVLVVQTGLVLWMRDSGIDYQAFCNGMGWTSLLVYVAAVGAATETAGWSRRIARQMPANPLGQLWVLLF